MYVDKCNYMISLWIRLAEVFVDRVVNTEVRESIVRINQTDL